MGKQIYPRVEKVQINIKCAKCKRKAKYCILYEAGLMECYCKRHLNETIAQNIAIAIFKKACEKAKEDLLKNNFFLLF